MMQLWRDDFRRKKVVQAREAENLLNVPRAGIKPLPLLFSSPGVTLMTKGVRCQDPSSPSHQPYYKEALTSSRARPHQRDSRHFNCFIASNLGALQECTQRVEVQETEAGG